MSPTSSFSGRRWLPRNVAAAVMQSVARRWLASIFRISRVRAPMNSPPHRCYCNCCYIQPADGWVFEDVRSSAAIFDARLVTSASCDLICLSSLGFAAIFDARRRLRRRRAAAAEIQRWWWSIIYEQEEDQEEDLDTASTSAAAFDARWHANCAQSGTNGAQPGTSQSRAVGM